MMSVRYASLAKDVLRNRLQLQIRCALVDLTDLRVAIQLLDRVVLHESVAAEQVDGERRDPLRDLGREDLAHRRLGEERLAGVAEPRGVVDEQPRRFELGGGARELMLDRLEFGDGLAELLALFRVLDGVVERALREADHLRANPDAPLVERFDRDLVAFADFAKDVRPRHAALLEQQFARAARADAELVLLLADGEAGGAALHEERGDAAVSRL